MPSNLEGTSAESQPKKNVEDINNRKNKEILQIKKKKNKQKKGRKNQGLTVVLRAIKNQSKQKIENGPLWSTARERTCRDHLWKNYTLVT